MAGCSAVRLIEKCGGPSHLTLYPGFAAQIVAKAASSLGSGAATELMGSSDNFLLGHRPFHRSGNHQDQLDWPTQQARPISLPSDGFLHDIDASWTRCSRSHVWISLPRGLNGVRPCGAVDGIRCAPKFMVSLSDLLVFPALLYIGLGLLHIAVYVRSPSLSWHFALLIFDCREQV